MTSTSQFLDRLLSLPDGGGLDGGYDAVIGADGFTGAASLTIPLPTTAARGISLDLELSYDSSAGNGEFGLGFALATPAITRMTTKGVPRYDDTDSYAMSGLGPLTPELDPATSRPLRRVETDATGSTWLVGTFLPCLQATLPLIEQWTDQATGISHWRVVSARGAESLFGATSLGRVADPADPARIFQWLVEETTDTHGNRTVFDYKAEDGESVRAEIYEQHRVITARRYLERIRYGNYYPAPPAGRARPGRAEEPQEFAFEVVFDYGEYDLDVSKPGSDPYVPVRPWPERPDPFSAYLAGFEVRTFRLCRGVLMFHRFPAELGQQPSLVRTTRLGYREDPSGSMLASATCTGYRRRDDGSYQTASLPPLELSYSSFDPPPVPRFRKLGVSGGPAAPGYLVKGSFLPVDLDGEGLPGFLLGIEDAGWYYPPEGGGHYGAGAPLPSVPDAAALADPRVSVEDMDGNGGLQLLVQARAAIGYFARTADSWTPFTPLRGLATSYGAPRCELADLDGDGRAELLFVHRDTVVYYPSLGTAGYGAPRAAARQPGFPAAANASATELVTFAGAFGDALAHRVRITDGEVAVWPNLGHGRFAPAVRLAGAPRLPRDLSAGRIYLADIDGSGTADLIFAHPDRLEIFRNRSGNGFAEPFAVPLPFQLTSHDQITFADVLGTGSTAIVVSRMAPVVEHWYCDLCETVAAGTVASLPGEVKVTRPNLLAGATNNLGVTCSASYASATSFLLADKRAGRPWLTRLPVPVQVLTQTVTTDQVGQTEATTTHVYHDGYYDSWYRQFQGFGLVETTMTQVAPGTPVAALTKTWHHTGAWTQSGELLARRRSEYFHGDPSAYLMPDSVLTPAVLAAGGETARQAYHALAGRVLRTEAYPADGELATGAQPVPFRVSDHNYTVRLVQAAEPGGYGSFYVTDREAVGYDYDTDPADPRIEHVMLLENTLTDRDGQDHYLERIATVAYPRRLASAPARDQVPEQRELRVVADLASYSRVTSGFRLVGMPLEARKLDTGGIAAPPGGYFSHPELSAAVHAALADEIPYGVPFAAGKVQSCPAAWERIYYWNAGQTTALPLGKVAPAGLCHHIEQAAFSDTWLAEVFGDRVSPGDLTLAGFVPDGRGYWWQPGEVTSFYTPDEPAGFRLPLRRESYALHTATTGPYALVTAGYDAPYRLIQTEQAAYADPRTAIGVTGAADYQAARLWELTDGNGVVQQALFDPLGAVLAKSVFKPASGSRPREGDADLRDYQVRADATFASVLADPGSYLQDAAAFYFYDRLAWLDRRTPAAAVAITATHYVSDASHVPRSVQTVIGYGDGAGRVIESRQEAEPAQPGGAPRWICADAAVYSVSGQLAASYLPFYSADPGFGPPPDAPPPRIVSYDAVGRQVRVLEPKGLLTRTEYTPWQQLAYDQDDTVLDSPYYIEFMATYPPDPTPAQRAEKDALDKAAKFYDTPDIGVLDNARNPVRRISDSLGDISAEAFAEIVRNSGVTSRELWDELHRTGYLVTRPMPAPHTGVTNLFEPYAPGFALRLDPPFDQFAAATADLLRPACLTTLGGFDVLGRLTKAIDPRLYYDSVRAGGALTSASFGYPMGRADAALAGSCDAGQRRMLTDVAARMVSVWDGRELRQDRSFDGLGRELTMSVTTPGSAPRTLEVITYGEDQEDPAAANLIGRVFQVKDEAGILLTPSYTMTGLPRTAERRFATDYSAEPDWSGDVPLDQQRYLTSLRYDALGRVVERTVPDGASVQAGYHVSGRLAWLRGQRAGADVSYLADVSYTAAGKRLVASFGNGAQQVAAYDAATLRLASLVTSAAGGRAVQRVAYTYDPVGNLTLARDDGAALAFGGPQPDGGGDYAYDATYRLRQASGLQHPGIDATTYATGFKQTLFAGLPAADADTTALELYTETYGYDDAGNLIATQHDAASSSFPRPTPVQQTSNRLAGTDYDGSGNPLTLLLADPVTLSWDSRGNLAASAPAAPEAPAGTERTWFSYDRFGERARMVVEHHAADGQLGYLADARYLGSYTDRRVITEQNPVGMPAGNALNVAEAGRLVAVAETGDDGSTQLRYQVADLLGSATVELAADGSLLSYEGFFPHGGSAVIAAGDQAAVEPKVTRYSGKDADDSTSLYYYGGRYLAPWLARWLSADPGGPADGLNLYSFVSGNPVTMTDANGREGGGVNDDPDPPPQDPATGNGPPPQQQQTGTPPQAGTPPQTDTTPPTTGATPQQPVTPQPVTPALDPSQFLLNLPPPPDTFGPPDRHDVRRFIIMVGIAAVNSILNGPRDVFYYGPIAVWRKFLGSPEEKALSKLNRQARREELRLIGYSLLVYAGMHPENFPEPVLRVIRPRRQSVLTEERPGGVPMNRAIDYNIRQPETYAEYVGGYFGSFVATGLVFLLTRRLMIRNMSPFMQKVTIPLPWIGGYLGLQGRGERKDRLWAEYERWRDTVLPEHRRLQLLEAEEQSGLPRTAVWRAYMAHKTEEYRKYAPIGIVIALAGVGLWALFLRKGGSWPFSGSGGQAGRGGTSSGWPGKQARDTANYYKKVFKLYYYNDLYMAQIRSQIYKKQATKWQYPAPQHTELTIYQPKPTQLTKVTPKPTQLMVRPANLPAVYVPPQTAITPYVKPGSLPVSVNSTTTKALMDVTPKALMDVTPKALMNVGTKALMRNPVGLVIFGVVTGGMALGSSMYKKPKSDK